mmetsp:Transcript_3139/g.8321  ORF Transcript_3139/g.8321 Transcript_3139/m.8321 type:complete len:221 (+) Transcript_3139:1-663(+)
MGLYSPPPFNADSMTDLLDKIHADDVPYPDDPELSPELSALFRSMLEKAPKERFRVRDVRKDPFLTDNGAQPLAEGGDKVMESNVAKLELKAALSGVASISRVSIFSEELRKSKHVPPSPEEDLQEEDEAAAGDAGAAGAPGQEGAPAAVEGAPTEEGPAAAEASAEPPAEPPLVPRGDEPPELVPAAGDGVATPSEVSKPSSPSEVAVDVPKADAPAPA